MGKVLMAEKVIKIYRVSATVDTNIKCCFSITA